MKLKLSMIIWIIKFIKHLNTKTETKLFTPEALSIINDKNKSIKLRNIIDEYHKTGQWNFDELSKLGL
jgi:hypothetical protein